MEPTEQVKELRNAFLDQLNTKGQDVHPNDLERIKKDDSYVRRFLDQHDQNQEAALNMMWETVTWRRELKVNDVNDIVKKDLLVQGGFFPHGRDKDGCSLFIFKCKKYVKGGADMDDLKMCVIYWFERLERQDNGKPITLFFDMEGCGLANMDLEFTRYLIGLFKQYYPSFLNYILIFEMPWVLSAAFKIIKSWLPEKAVQKIKFLSKKDIKDYVPLDQALVCWGGQNEYVYSFMPESEPSSPQPLEEVAENNKEVAANAPATGTPNASNRKQVHFADGSSSMSESPEGSGDKEQDVGSSSLVVHPTNIITFTKENGELVSTVELHNTDPVAILSYKLKTTSPEKFRVRPSVGCLTPGSRATIHVTLLPGFQLGGLSRDKFLIMSTIITPNELTQEMSSLWKDTSGRKVNQHRLKCAQPNDVITRNGSAVAIGGGGASSTPENGPSNHFAQQLSHDIQKLHQCQGQLHATIRHTQYMQLATLLMVIFLGCMLYYAFPANNDQQQLNQSDPSGSYCRDLNSP